MELVEYFTPADLEHFAEHYAAIAQSIGSVAQVYAPGEPFPDWRQADIVLLAVADDRGSVGRKGSADAPRAIRQYIYQLAAPLTTIKVCDLGDFRFQDELDDLYNDISDVTELLLKAGKTVILLGGTQDIVYGQYMGFQGLEQQVEYVTVDSSPDILDPISGGLNHQTFNNAILTHAPNYLGSFAHLAAQTYFITEGERRAMKSLNFETVRVGEIHANLHVAEPFLRTAHMVSFDLSALRHADAPGTNHPSPAGLTVEQACTLARYAGMGYNVQAVSFCEMNPEMDIRNMTAHLTSLMIWYFIDGYYNRLNDQPKADRSNLQKYIARLQGPVPEIIFFKSERTGRWWMEVPSPEPSKTGPPRSVLLACSEADYRQALHNEIPERWWVTHYRFQ